MQDNPVYTPASMATAKPAKVQTLAVLTLISGIFSVVSGIGWAIGLIITIVGICFLPLVAYPIVVGILEIIYGAKLLSNRPEPVKPAVYLAILEIINILFVNIFSLIVGILALVFYEDEEVKHYFARL